MNKQCQLNSEVKQLHRKSGLFLSKLKINFENDRKNKETGRQKENVRERKIKRKRERVEWAGSEMRKLIGKFSRRGNIIWPKFSLQNAKMLAQKLLSKTHACINAYKIFTNDHTALWLHHGFYCN